MEAIKLNERASAALGELAAAVRLVTDTALARRLGAHEFRKLTPRKRVELGRKLSTVRAAEAIGRLTPRGQREAAMTDLIGVLQRRFGWRLPATTLGRWRAVYRDRGIVGLLDRRGRWASDAKLDTDMLVRFSEELQRGTGERAAHRLILRRAERENLMWPRGFAVLCRMLRDREGM